DRIRRESYWIALPAANVDITGRRGHIGDRYGKEGSQPHRQACGEPGQDAPNDAFHEPGKARRRPWSDIPAGPKIRERDQPDRRQPSPTDLADSSGTGFLLF